MPNFISKVYICFTYSLLSPEQNAGMFDLWELLGLRKVKCLYEYITTNLRLAISHLTYKFSINTFKLPFLHCISIKTISILLII